MTESKRINEINKYLEEEGPHIGTNYGLSAENDLSWVNECPRFTIAEQYYALSHIDQYMYEVEHELAWLKEKLQIANKEINRLYPDHYLKLVDRHERLRAAWY